MGANRAKLLGLLGLLAWLAGPGDARGVTACETGSEYRYAFKNLCTETVWVGLTGTKTPGDFQPEGLHYAAAPKCRSNADCRSNGQTSGLCDFDSGQCLCGNDGECGGAACLPNGKCSTWVDFCLPQTYTSGSFFPRTGCVAGNSGGVQTLACETGSCFNAQGQALLDCLSGGGASPSNPVTQIEVTSTPTSVNYDVSLAAGFNVESYAAPVGGGNTEPNVPASQIFQCPAAGCNSDLNQTCPAKLRLAGRSRPVVGCLDPCTACSRGFPGLACDDPAPSGVSSTDCGGTPFQATHEDLYCAFGPTSVGGPAKDTTTQASANQGTPTAFGPLDCKPPRVFVQPTFGGGYVLPPGQGVCLHPNLSNDYSWAAASGATLTCGGPGAPDGTACGGYETKAADGSTFAGALGYQCRTTTSSFQGAPVHLCMPPVANGLGVCTKSTPAPPTRQFYPSGAGVLNPDWLAVGVVAGSGTPYYQTFKESCPAAYTWQYDDASAGFSCLTDKAANQPPGTRGEPFSGLNVTFCGSRDAGDVDDVPPGSVVALRAVGQARSKPSRRGQGVVQMRGSFVVPKAIPLDQAELQLVNVLDESGGAGELLRGVAGARSLPLVLRPLPGATRNGAIFQSPPGSRPFVRVQLTSDGVGSDRSTVRVAMDITKAFIGRPSRCSPRRKGGTSLETSFQLQVDSPRSVFVGANLPWQCRQGQLQRTR